MFFLIWECIKQIPIWTIQEMIYNLWKFKLSYLNIFDVQSLQLHRQLTKTIDFE
jgi:hypothetical protein